MPDSTPSMPCINGAQHADHSCSNHLPYTRCRTGKKQMYDGTETSISTSTSYICTCGDSSYQLGIGARSPVCHRHRRRHGRSLTILPIYSNFLNLEARWGWQGGWGAGFTCCLPRGCGQALPVKANHGAMFAFILSFMASYLELPMSNIESASVKI